VGGLGGSSKKDAERRQADGPKLRLLVIHEKGDDLDNALVVMRLEQFTEWFLSMNELGKVKSS